MNITIIGASGFIGSSLSRYLTEQGLDPSCPPRDALPNHQDIGVLVYCAGITVGFRESPATCFQSHAGALAQLLENNKVAKVIYVSSTRVYRESAIESTEEDRGLTALAGVTDIYNLSKIAGESLTLSHSPVNTVLRLSNVVGKPSKMKAFIGQLYKQIHTSGAVDLGDHPESAKDYITIGTVVEIISRVIQEDCPGVYNVCNGFNITHAEWLQHLRSMFKFELRTSDDRRISRYAEISNKKIKDKLGFKAESRESIFAALIDHQ